MLEPRIKRICLMLELAEVVIEKPNRAIVATGRDVFSSKAEDIPGGVYCDRNEGAIHARTGIRCVSLQYLRRTKKPRYIETRDIRTIRFMGINHETENVGCRQRANGCDECPICVWKTDLQLLFDRM